MFVPSKSTQARYRKNPVTPLTLHGAGFHTSSVKTGSNQPLNLLDHDHVFGQQGSVSHFPVFIDCSCDRLVVPPARSGTKSNNHEIRIGDIYQRLVASNNSEHLDKNEFEEQEEEGKGTKSLSLVKLLSTLQKFSSGTINSEQVLRVTQLAEGFQGEELMTLHHSHTLLKLLACESPPLQEAVLIIIGKLAAKGDNVDHLFCHCPDLLDHILSLASDPPTQEIQMAALSTIEQITGHDAYTRRWEKQVEDLVYPLLQEIIKNQGSPEELKLKSLQVIRNLSSLPDFGAKMKQDILLRLNLGQVDRKVKGIYLEILWKNLPPCKQGIASDVLNKTLLPVLAEMLAFGSCHNQCQSVRLLMRLYNDDLNRIFILSSPQLLALCVLCVRYSNCRKVLLHSCHMMKKILNTKVVFEARRFMESISESYKLVAREPLSPEPGSWRSRGEKVRSPLQGKGLAEAQLWCHFDDFVNKLILILDQQGCIVPYNSHSVKCELDESRSLDGDQLSCLLSLITCFSGLCMWPVKQPKKSLGNIEDMEELLSLGTFGCNLKNLNHHHAMYVWARVGARIMSLLRQIVKRILTSFPELFSTKKPPNMEASVDGESAKLPPLHSDTHKAAGNNEISNLNTSHLTGLNTNAVQDLKDSDESSKPALPTCKPKELELLRELVKFVMVISAAACYGKKLSSHFQGGWPRAFQRSSQGIGKKVRVELVEKEMCSERLILRHSLVNEGVFFLMAQLVMMEDADLKAIATTILRLCLQPVSEKAQAASAKSPLQSITIRTPKARPQSQSSKTVSNAYARNSINQTLFQMTRPGVAQRPQSSAAYYTTSSDPAANINRSTTPRTGRETSNLSRSASSNYSFSPLTPRVDKKQLCSRSGSEVFHLSPRQAPGDDANVSDEYTLCDVDSKQGTFLNCHSGKKTESWIDPATARALVAPLDPGHSLSQQCCDRALLAVGDTALKGIFSSDFIVRKSCLLFLHDLVLHSRTEVHMELSRNGCVPKLIDFLRINDDNELLEVTGLIITRMMVSSDQRICQLFNVHGGTSMLMALLQKRPTKDLKQAIASTLSTVNFVMHRAAATDSSNEDTSRPTDIWEHIMRRWEGEDKTVTILKQFL